MKESVLFDKIEAYIRNRMSNEEKNDFEQQIKADSRLAEKLRQHQEEQKILELFVEVDLKSRLNQWDELEVIDIDEKSNQKFWPLFLLLAGLFILVAFLWNNFYKKDYPSVNQIEFEEQIEQELPIKEVKEEKNEPLPNDSSFQKNDQPIADKTELLNKKNNVIPNKTPFDESKLLVLQEAYFIPFSVRSSQTSSSDLLTKRDTINRALLLFEQGKYNLGNNFLRSLLEKDADDIELNYYLGAGLYSEKKFNDAITYLNLIIKDPNFLFFEDAEWMLALSYMFQADYLPSKEILEKISTDSEHSYSAQSKMILTNL